MQEIRHAEIMYQYGESAQFKTVFYFIAQKIKAVNYLSERKEQHNSEQTQKFNLNMIYLHAINVMYPYLAKSFDVVLDFTAASLSETVQMISILINIIKVIPAQARSNINKLYVLQLYGSVI